MKQQEDYVSFELANKLKACGFSEQCDHYYLIFGDDRKESFMESSLATNYNSDDWTSTNYPHCSVPRH